VGWQVLAKLTSLSDSFPVHPIQPIQRVLVNWHVLTELTKTLAWPVTVLVLAIVLRKKISGMLDRIQSARLPGGAEFSFGNPTVDKPAESMLRPLSKPEGLSPDLTKVGNLFWLSHDIMWTIDVVLRGAPRSTIVYGLRQAQHHLSELGLAHTRMAEVLAKLHDKAERTVEPDWSATLRNSFAVELRHLSDDLGRLFASKQSSFKPNPDDT
jgi:hypothetical protein